MYIYCVKTPTGLTFDSLLKLLHEAGDIEDVLGGEELGRAGAKLGRKHAAAHPLAIRAVLNRVRRP